MEAKTAVKSKDKKWEYWILANRTSNLLTPRKRIAVTYFSIGVWFANLTLGNALYDTKGMAMGGMRACMQMAAILIWGYFASKFERYLIKGPKGTPPGA